MQISDEIKVTWSSFIDIRYGKLVLVERRISEGYYDTPAVIDLVVGSLLDIMA